MSEPWISQSILWSSHIFRPVLQTSDMLQSKRNKDLFWKWCFLYHCLIATWKWLEDIFDLISAVLMIIGKQLYCLLCVWIVNYYICYSSLILIFYILTRNMYSVVGLVWVGRWGWAIAWVGESDCVGVCMLVCMVVCRRSGDMGMWVGMCGGVHASLHGGVQDEWGHGYVSGYVWGCAC